MDPQVWTANPENKVQLDDKDHVVFPDHQESPEKLSMRTDKTSSVDLLENKVNRVSKVFKDLLDSPDDVESKVRLAETVHLDHEERKVSPDRTDFEVPMESRETKDPKVNGVLTELLEIQDQVVRLAHEAPQAPKENADLLDHVVPLVRTLSE